MSGREKGLLLLLVLVVLPVGLWFLAAVPIMESRDRAVMRLAEARALNAWVRARDEEWQGGDAEMSPTAVPPVGLSGLDRALSDAGLRDATSRLENAQDGAVSIRLDGADFARVGPFLEMLERRLGYDIATLRLLRGDEGGLVDLELDLVPES